MEKPTLIVTIIWYTLGICTMLPWNFFITADGFWQYKLRNTTLDSASNDSGSPLTDLQVAFTPTLVIISNLSVFLFSFVTSALATRVKEKSRMLGSLYLSLLTMGIVTLLAILNTDEWQMTFFVITMAMIALLNVGIAVLQGSLYGLAGLFPSEIVSALYSGQAVAGVVSSLAMIISLGIGDEDPVVSGIIYFVMADVFLVVTIVAYLRLIKTEMYEICKREEALAESQSKAAPKSWSHYKRVFWKIKWQGFTLGYVLCITLSVFPAVTVYITSSLQSSTWTNIYFQPTITFLLFNVLDMVGRETTRWIQWPSHKGYLLHIMGLLRTIFIPLMLLCHGENKSFPTIFHNDLAYIIINFLFAFTNGYLSNLALIYFSRFLPEEEIELGGTIMASLMGVGMVVGSAASPGFVKLWGAK